MEVASTESTGRVFQRSSPLPECPLKRTSGYAIPWLEHVVTELTSQKVIRVSAAFARQPAEGAFHAVGASTGYQNVLAALTERRQTQNEPKLLQSVHNLSTYNCAYTRYKPYICFPN